MNQFNRIVFFVIAGIGTNAIAQSAPAPGNSYQPFPSNYSTFPSPASNGQLSQLPQPYPTSNPNVPPSTPMPTTNLPGVPALPQQTPLPNQHVPQPFNQGLLPAIGTNAPTVSGNVELASATQAEPIRVATKPESYGKWIDPGYWMPPTDWDISFQLGINGSAGNSESMSLQTGADFTRKTKMTEFEIDMDYARTSTAGIQTQHNAIFNARAERLFHEGSRWTMFTKFFMEYDEFKPFDLRLALNAGVGYKLIDTEVTKLKPRFGAGVSHEIGGPDDRYVPEMLAGFDFERQLTKNQKFELTVDYFPDWNDFMDYRLVSDIGWVYLIDGKGDLSLKVSALDRYDSTPNGAKPNDINYSVVLIWKL